MPQRFKRQEPPIEQELVPVDETTEEKLSVATTELGEVAKAVARLTIERSAEVAANVQLRYLTELRGISDQMDRWFKAFSDDAKDFMARADHRFDELWNSIDTLTDNQRKIREDADRDRGDGFRRLSEDMRSMKTEFSMRIQSIEEEIRLQTSPKLSEPSIDDEP